MTDIMASQSYSKVAMKKIKPDHPDFRIYCAGWIGNFETTDTMEVRGAIFRIAKTGPNKGKLAIKVPGTQRTAYVTVAEMKAQDIDDGII